MNKYNGMNVLFYKYTDKKGKTFISAKSKGTPFLGNSPFGEFLNLSLLALGVKDVGKKESKTDLYKDPLGFCIPKVDLFNNPPNAFIKKLAEDKNIQSMSFELCGQKEPHLVHYDFDISLKPLFYQTYQGDIAPITENLDEKFYGPIKYDQDQLVKDCIEFQKKDLKANENYRKSKGLSQRYEHDHFIVEGKVLYTLDEKGFILKRTMYKIKPKDIEEVHWGLFDVQMEGRVKEALQKMTLREMPMNYESLRSEMDMKDKEWSKFGDAVKYYIECVLKPKDMDIPKDKRKLILLIGLPSSGKTRFAQQVKSKKVSVVSSNATKSKDVCLKMARDSFKKRKSVVIDDVNHDEKERAQWIALAKEVGVEHFIGIYFDVPQETLLKREKERQGDKKDRATGFVSGVKNDDKMFDIFVKKFKAPTKDEFTEFYVIKKDDDDHDVVESVFRNSKDESVDESKEDDEETIEE
jgi:predicted kinase